MKLYLRELEEPLIPFSHYNKTVTAMRSFENSHNVSELKAVLTNLPDLNRAILSRLIQFLTMVGAASAKNRMDLKNLGIVFGPTLLRPIKETLETMMSDTNIVNLFTATLIERYSDLFEGGAESPRLASSGDSAPSADETAPEEKKKRRKEKKDKAGDAN